MSTNRPPSFTYILEYICSNPTTWSTYMEVTQIIGLSSSSLIAVAGLIFTESIKEIIKKYFAVKSKKKINKLYWIILISAIAIPIIITLVAGNKTDTQRIIIAPQQSNGVQQIPNH